MVAILRAIQSYRFWGGGGDFASSYRRDNELKNLS
jgi:hypothetical protein